MAQNRETPKKQGASDREDRLRAALKANMAKRKSQAKARAATQQDNKRDQEQD